VAGQVSNRKCATGGGDGILTAAVHVMGLIDGALPPLPIYQSVGILGEINILVEVRHYRDQAADGNGNTATGVVARIGTSGNCETEAGRNGAQRDDRGLLQDGHEDSLPAVSALVADPVRPCQCIETQNLTQPRGKP